MKISVIGTGYVGLVTGACLADVGNTVVCLDIDARKIEMLTRGSIPIHEPGLDLLVRRNVAASRLSFTTDVAAAARHGDVQFIAVGTPPDEDGSADLQYVLAAARSIGRYMDRPVTIVDKSTVPVGTADAVRAAVTEELLARSSSLKFDVVSNPEFLKEGAAIEDFMRPDRIVVGADDDQALRVMKRVYAPFERNHEKVLSMDVRSAEMTKYVANAMLATRISFMNEMALLAEALGADIEAVRKGIGSDPRIGNHFLYPGCGYGGSCFPKDVKALRHMAGARAVPAQVLEAVERANQHQKQVLVEKIERRFGSDLSGLTFALWGLAFKPDTDDMREAPSIVVIEQLIERGASIRAYDPVASSEARRLLGHHANFKLCAHAFDALDGSDALVIVTEWKEFRSPDYKRIVALLRQPLVFDGRNVLDPAMAQAAGMDYHGIGRAPITGAHESL